MISSWKKLKAARRSRKEQPAGEEGGPFLAKDPLSLPTPTIPLSSVQVLEISSKITAAWELKDQATCRDLVAKMNRLAKESDANKRCFSGNRTVKSSLAAAFEAFSKTFPEEDAGTAAVLEEILSALTLLLPLDGEPLTFLGSFTSVRRTLLFLKTGDLLKRRNAVLLLRELVVCSHDRIKVSDVLLETDENGAVEALVKLIKEPIDPSATKAALVVIYHMITYTTAINEKLIQKFVDLGLVPSLLEMLVDAQRSVCEKVLSVLDGICSSENGRENAGSTPLTMPVIVKKVLRVSDLATELSVSIMWKLCKNVETREEKSAFEEALQVGAFQKLLLLLQVGCGERTKEKASELLKLVNLHGDRFECSHGWIKNWKSL